MNKKQRIRENFRTAVFARDNHKCIICGDIDNLNAHHITDRNEMPNGGYVVENGASLCPECHKIAELWHETNGEDFVIGYTPYDLYEKIKSSYKLAFRKSMD